MSRAKRALRKLDRRINKAVGSVVKSLIVFPINTPVDTSNAAYSWRVSLNNVEYTSKNIVGSDDNLSRNDALYSQEAELAAVAARFKMGDKLYYTNQSFDERNKYNYSPSILMEGTSNQVPRRAYVIIEQEYKQHVKEHMPKAVSKGIKIPVLDTLIFGGINR